MQGAVREVKEEVGLDLDASSGKLLFSKVRKTLNGRKFNDILDVWLFEYNGEVDLSASTTEEVAQTCWMTRKQIRDLFDRGLLVDSLSYFFDCPGLAG